MAKGEISFYSESLHRMVPLTLIFPDRMDEPGKVLYLLHGYSDAHDTFVRNSSLERYLAGSNVMAVMPDGACSFYTDMACGGDYWTYISRELPDKIGKWFHVDSSRENSCVGGISMGGYGAAKLALHRPERFSKAFLFSPVTDMVKLFKEGFNRELDPTVPTLEDLHLREIFGSLPVEGGPGDLYHLLSKRAAQGCKLPEFHIYTGTEDFIYEETCRFARTLERQGCLGELVTSPGLHRWSTWDPFLEMMAQRLLPGLDEGELLL